MENQGILAKPKPIEQRPQEKKSRFRAMIHMLKHVFSLIS